MLLAALLALTGWTIGAPPTGYELVAARQYDHMQVTRSGRPTPDPDDAPVALWAYDPGHSPFTVPPAPQTTVRGQAAEFSDLSSDGDTYGRTLRWIEPSGVTLALEVDSRPSDARLHALAESVREEPPERWKALRIAMSRPPRLDKLPAGMKRVVVRRSRGLTLTALLPPGFPVAPEDRRKACYRLSYRGQRSYGYSCAEPTSWKRIGGTIFIYGTLPARVKRVRVRGEGGVDARARTYRAPGYPLASFYAVPLPTSTCEVRVTDADRGTRSDRRVR